jgi:hypothetical protein
MAYVKVCDQRDDLAFPLRLTQSGPDSFAVIYGQEVHAGLNYTEAAQQYGSCLMHALTCSGGIDFEFEEC